MRILMLGGGYGPESARGSATVVTELTDLLRARGHKVHIVARALPGQKMVDHGHVTWLHVNHRPIMHYYDWNVRHRGEIRKTIDDFGPDVICQHSIDYSGAISGYVRAPVVYFPHDFIGPLYVKAFRERSSLPRFAADRIIRKRQRLEDRCCASASQVVVFSEFLRNKAISRGAPPERVCVIPNGVNLSRFSPRGKTADLRSPNALYVGRVEEAKGIEYLLEAARMLPHVTFYLLGYEVKKYDYPNNVVVLGRISDDISGYYRAADVLVHPHINSGFEMTGLEAMACGVPVIMTHDPTRTPIYEGTAHMIPQRDAGAIVDGINKILGTESVAGGRSEDGCRAQMSRDGLALVRQYDWRHIVEQLEGVLKRLLD